MNAEELITGVAMRGLKNIQMNDGDYYDDAGMLVCGHCKAHKTRIQSLDIRTLDGGKRHTEYLVACLCDCETEKRDRKIQERAERERVERVMRLKQNSLLDARFAEATFRNFRVDRYNEKPFGVVKRYVENFEEAEKRNQGLILWGDVGTGKTYSAACIANELLERGVSVVMTSFVKILETSQGDIEAGKELMRQISTARLLIIDDFGAERDTAYAFEKVFSVIDDRYRKTKPIILTTNLSAPEMYRETDIRYKRLYERIFETCYPIEFTGNSKRRSGASKRMESMRDFLGVSD